MTDTPILEARGVGKTFPGTQALDSVDFAIYPGKVHALVGENGAGKSTLVKILAGIETPTAGTLLESGRPIRLESARDADRFGIGIIHQELNLLLNLSVAENIFAGRELCRYGVLVDRRGQQRVTRELMARLDHPIPPDTLVGSLPLGRRQLVEIAKALARRVRVLMMDEPTSALSAAEVEVLFRVVRELTAAGVAVVYISHRLQELLRLAADVTVLRAGRVVGRAAAGEIGAGWIVERMTGHAAAARQPEITAPFPASPPVLRAGEIELRAGEIVGLYGLMGAGRSELGAALFGLDRGRSGQILLGGMALTPRVSVAWQHAFGALTPTETLTFNSTGQTFAVAGLPIARDTALFDGGLDLRLSPRAEVGLSYSGQYGARATSNSIKGNLTWLFRRGC